MKVYKDTNRKAKEHVLESNKARSTYYELATNQKLGNKENYDICINCEIGNDKVVYIICQYIKNKNK